MITDTVKSTAIVCPTRWEDSWNGLWKLVLPAITLGTFFSGLVARIIRSSLLEVLDKDYIKAARARGVWPAALVYRHAFANALIPVVTVIGLQFGARPAVSNPSVNQP